MSEAPGCCHPARQTEPPRERVSLTTNGDTSADSGVAVDRYPTANRDKINYDRMTTTDSCRPCHPHGKGVVVIHGVDYK